MSSKNILKSICVMYVEDEENIRNMAKTALEDEFGKFILATNGFDGLKKFKEFTPNIVIADIAMPLMDGLEMSRKIKEISPKTPIIILSAYSDKDRLLKAIDLGVDKYFIKPVDIDELLSTVNKIISKYLNFDNIVKITKDYKFDKKNKVLINKDKNIHLTKKELKFISLFVEKADSLVLHEEIKKHVWQNEKVSNSAIRAFIKRIRCKTHYEFIENISGLGYKINNIE